MRALIVLFLMGFLAFPASAQDWTDADLGARIREGAATRDHIWLFGASQKVVRFDRKTGERTVVAERVRDFLPDGEKLWVLVQGTDKASFSLRDVRSSDAEALPGDRRYRVYLHPSDTSEGEVLGLFKWPGEARPAILSQRAIVAPTAEGWKRHNIAASLGQWGRIATADGRSVYVGYNLGEWGGGLRRIETATGTISFVSEPGDDICGGTLNPACEPVVGLFRDREAPDCVIVGTGLSHLGMSFGRINRVCGAAISSVFSTPAPAQPDRWMMSPQPWPLDELVETPDGWIGLSRDRYFQSRRGHVEEQPLPAFEDWAGLRLSREVDGVLFLVSACCWGSSAGELFSTLAVTVGE